MAISTWPPAMRAAHPEEDPPVEYPALRGFSITPVLAVLLPPETHKYSQAALPVILASASSTRDHGSIEVRDKSVHDRGPVHHRYARNKDYVLDCNGPAHERARAGAFDR